MRQSNILIVVALVSLLGLTACDSRAVTTSVVPTPVSVIPTATSLPISTTTAAPTVTEPPTQIPTETPAAPTATLCPTSTPDGPVGQILFLAAKCDAVGVCPHPSIIYRIRSDGSGLQQVFQSQADIFELALSPDGTTFAFTEDYGWGYQVHIFDLATGNTWPLVDLPYNTRLPRWVSEDQLLCVARPVSGGANNIYIADVDGGGWQQLSEYPSTIAFFDLAVSPDGTQCLFAKYDSDADRTTVSRMNVDRTGLQELISLPGHHPVDVGWSPSGRWMTIYPTGSTDLIPIYLANREGAETVEIVQLADSPQLLAWASDESELIFLEIRSGSVMAVRRDGNGTRMIARVSGPGELAVVSDLYLSPVALSPDQAQLVFSPLGGGLYVMDMHTECWQQLMSGYLAFTILWVP